MNAWRTSRSVIGWLVAFGEGDRGCEFGLDQWGRMRFMSYGPDGKPPNSSLFEEVSAAVIDLRSLSEQRRFGGKFSEERARLCGAAAAELNSRGISPHKQLSTCQRPEGDQL